MLIVPDSLKYKCSLPTSLKSAGPFSAVQPFERVRVLWWIILFSASASTLSPSMICSRLSAGIMFPAVEFTG